MIYTVTFNPSLDYIVSVDDFTLGRVNRTTKELVYPGGKGVNVSLVLKNLGMENTALGFTAGFTGTEIERGLKEWGCLTDFIRIPEGMSRINMKLRSREESEVNGQGPKISEEALEELYKKLDAMEPEDVLVLAGSIPSSMPDSSYEQILARVQHKNIRSVVDATGDLLVNVLKYHPFLIKPNNHELEEIFHVPMDSGACKENAGDGSPECADFHGGRRRDPCGGRRKRMAEPCAEGKSGEFSGSRGFHGGRIYHRIFKEQSLRRSLSYGNLYRKRQRIFRTAGNPGRG